MKIEMAVACLDLGGLEVVVARTARAMAARGLDVGVTCIERGGAIADELRANGIRVDVIPAPGLLTNLRAPALEAHLKCRAPDILHVHSGCWPKVARAGRRVRVPAIVHTAHGLEEHEPFFGPWLKRCAGAATHRITVVSKPLFEYFVNVVGLDPSKIEIVLNGIDTGVFSPGPADLAVRESWGLKADHLVVGMVARFSPGKNHALLIKAFRQVANEVPEAMLVLVGDGPTRGEVEGLVGAFGLEDRVHFTGVRLDLQDLYRAFDVFVLPSLAEGTSMSILEAMASGICIVATDVGGNPDLLSGQSGILIPSGDEASLATAISNVLTDVEARIEFGRRARHRAVESYAERDTVDRYLEIFNAVLDSRAQRGGEN